VVPLTLSLFTQRLPWCASAVLIATERPIPLPGAPYLVAGLRQTNLENVPRLGGINHGTHVVYRDNFAALLQNRNSDRGISSPI